MKFAIEMALIVAVSFVTALLVAGCGSEYSPPQGTEYYVTQNLDGVTTDVTVTCPEGRLASEAKLHFFQNGKPKELRIACR